MSETTLPAGDTVTGAAPAGDGGETEAPTLTSADRNRTFWRFFWSSQISWNYERMQALGFAWAMEPVLRKLYRDQESYTEGLQRHLTFFNTNPIIGGPLILGSAVAMEEARAKTSAEGVKVGLMGPMAGIGDTLVFALYNSIILTIAASWALEGRWLGPIFAAVMVLVPYLLVRRWQFTFAYRRGRELVGSIAGGALDRLSEGATVLGLVVLGGFIPSIVKLVTTVTYSQTVTVQGEEVKQTVAVQDQIDDVLPYLLPVALTAVVYWVLKKRNVHPLWVIAGVFALGLALGWTGWFAPTLPEK